jgi:hypothetical protein
LGLLVELFLDAMETLPEFFPSISNFISYDDIC